MEDKGKNGSPANRFGSASVDQFLAANAVPGPRNRLEALQTDFLTASPALSERASIGFDPARRSPLSRDSQLDSVASQTFRQRGKRWHDLLRP